MPQSTQSTQPAKSYRHIEPGVKLEQSKNTTLPPAQVVFQGPKEGDEVLICEERLVVGENKPPLALLEQQIEEELAEDKKKLLLRIEEAKKSISAAEQDIQDHEELIEKNKETIHSCKSRIGELVKMEKEKDEEKQKAMEEEMKLEQLRAAKHAEAVSAENQRAESKAKRIACEQQEQHAERLLDHHKKAIDNMLNIIRAQKLAIESSQVQLKVLEQQKDVRLMAERSKIEEQALNVSVEVKPEMIPEARMRSGAQTSTKAAGAAIIEHKPAHKEASHTEESLVSAHSKKHETREKRQEISLEE